MKKYNEYIFYCMCQIYILNSIKFINMLVILTLMTQNIFLIELNVFSIPEILKLFRVRRTLDKNNSKGTILQPQN